MVVHFKLPCEHGSDDCLLRLFDYIVWRARISPDGNLHDWINQASTPLSAAKLPWNFER